MLISLSQPFDSLQNTCKGIKILKQKMENPSGKRRRYTSQTSNTSTSTQFTHLSDDSSRTTSPDDVKQFGDRQIRPIFRLGSEDEGKPATSTPSRTNKAAIERELAFLPDRRKYLAAKRSKIGRRQSDSVIENPPHQRAPHRCHTTMCVEHGSMMEGFDVINEETHPKCSYGLHNRLQYPSQSTSNLGGEISAFRQNYSPNAYFDPSLFPQRKPRANSVDALNALRVRPPHIYDDVNTTQPIDTEVLLSENARPVVRASRKRLNSSMSESPVERFNNDRQIDSDSAYVRASKTTRKEGFCDTLCACLKRRALLILIVLNILLLFVNFAGMPFLVIKVLENDKGSSTPMQTEHCFGCNEITLQDRERISSIAGVFMVNDRGQCCFNTSESFTSWIVKEITSKRVFVYVKGEDIVHTGGENRIRWGDSGKMGPVSLVSDRTAVVINEPGYYFIFSRVHFVKSKPANQTSQLTLWHAIKHTRDSKRGDLESASQTCNLQRDSQHSEHNSVLETIAYLRANDQVYVSTRGHDSVDRNKEHSLGLFRIK